MKRKFPLFLFFLILLAGCNDNEEITEIKGQPPVVEDVHQLKKEIVIEEVNLDYVAWHINHKNNVYNLLVENTEYIEAYQEDKFLNSIATLNMLIEESVSLDFTDPSKKLKPIHSEYVRSLDSLDGLVELSSFIFNENGSLNEEHYKNFRKTVSDWTSRLVPIANAMVPYEGIFHFTNFISESPTPDNYDKRAGYFELANLKEAALKDYEQAYKLLPQSSYLKEKTEELSLELGKNKENISKESSFTNKSKETTIDESSVESDNQTFERDSSENFIAMNSKFFIKGITLGDEKDTVIENWGHPITETIDYEYDPNYTILEYEGLRINIYENKVDSISMKLDAEVFDNDFLTPYSGDKYISQDSGIYLHELNSNQLIIFKEENQETLLILGYSDGNFAANINDGYIEKLK